MSEINDKYLRLSAEFDNYRKRTLKERMELTKNAGEQILEKILPVMDNFERALKSMDTAEDVPVLFVSGDRDPVGHYGRDVLKLYELYHRRVSHNVACYLYEDCRHEILNELCRDKVFDDIDKWLETRLADIKG